MCNELVSIIIPVYNSEKYISRCLNSCFNQTYNNLEIIVINDGSKDDSLKIINSFLPNYSDKLVVVDQKNCGAANTRNNGIDLAHGKYLMFIDNDDWIEEDYVEKYVDEIEKNNLDVVIGGYKRINSDGKVLMQVDLDCHPYSKYKVQAPWAHIYKTSFIKSNNIRFLNTNILEDLPFTMESVTLTDKVEVFNYTGYIWFYNDDSVSNTIQKNLENDLNFIYSINKIYDDLISNEIVIDKYIEYYFIKLFVWFMLFSTKRVNMKLISSTYDEIKEWIETRFPKFQSNELIGLNTPLGETSKIQKSVYFFMILIKLKLIKPFLFLYSRI